MPQFISGLGRAKCTLPVAAGFIGIVVGFFTIQCGPLFGGAGSSSHYNDVASCPFPTLLFSSAVLGPTNRFREEANCGFRRGNEKKKSGLGFGVGNIFRIIPAAAKALGDGLRNIFGDAQKGRSVAAGGEEGQSPVVFTHKEVGMHRNGAEREDERNSAEARHLRKSGQRKTSVKDVSRLLPEPVEPQRFLAADGQNVSAERLPLKLLPVSPLVVATPATGPVPAPPSWLLLEGGRLQWIPHSRRDGGAVQKQAYYVANEWVRTLGQHRQAEAAEGRRDTVQTGPLKGGVETRLGRPNKNSPITLDKVPEELKHLVVFPEEDVLFVDKQATRAIAKAANTIAATVINQPSEKSRLLAKTFPADQVFYVIPRKGTTLFDRFGMVPGRFLGEGSFGIVFEGKTSGGATFAVKVCIVAVSSSMSPAREQKLVDECEASEIRIPELFPRSVDPPTLFYSYRMVVPLLTGRIAHLPPVYSLGENLYGTHVCALYPSALCDVQQLCSSVKLPPAVQMELTRNMVTVVARLHLLNIVHLDIKLANFLIDQQGRVVLSDFGLAMRKQNFPVMISCRSGSPAFMSPEMIRCLTRNKNSDGKIALSSKMDAFSLGVTLYMIWCGVLPFSFAATGGTVNQLVEALDKVYEDGGHLSFQNCPGGDISDSEVKAIIIEFLRVDPEKRATPLDVVRASTIFLKRL